MDQMAEMEKENVDLTAKLSGMEEEATLAAQEA